MIEKLYYSNQFMAADQSFAAANIVLFGCPFDGTVSYRPGSRFAANAIREASWGLETYSPVLDLDLVDLKFHDGGDIELPFGNSLTALAMVQEITADILRANKVPFMIGGEHSLTLAPVKACADFFPNLQVVQLDAHCDLRTDYLGDELSHACVARRIVEYLSTECLFQFGIRSGTKTEYDFARQHQIQYDIKQAAEVAARLRNKPVYLTIDLDVLDPSVLPGTGTPEPGGLTFQELFSILRNFAGLNLVGMDVVELAPNLDPSGVSTIVAAKIIRECLLMFWGSKK